MNDMRKLINLMEGVTAVPELNEKSTSEKQARFMAAAAHDPKFAKKTGMDQDVAKEFNKADTGTKQLSNAMKEEYCMDECADAVSTALQKYQELISNGEDMHVALDTVIKDCAADGCSEEDISKIHDSITNGATDVGMHNDIESDMTFGDVEEDYDLNNGVDSIHYATGSDYFPNGADRPVTEPKLGAVAKYGNNAISETAEDVHKELVYGYRSYLKEAAKRK